MSDAESNRLLDSRSRRRVFLLGLALGLILGAGATIALGALIDFSPGGPAFYTEQSTDVLDASIGDCLLRTDADHVTVSCGESAVSEVYAVAAPPVRNAERYPGREVLDMFGAAACELAFENHLNESYLTSQRDYRVLIPSEGAWSARHTEIYCLLRR